MIARRPRGTALALAVAVLLLVTSSPAWAAFRFSGPGCPDNPDDLINNAASGDVITPLFEEDAGRNTNGAVLKVNAEFEGGWSHPGFTCGGSSTGTFADREAMLAAGFSYNPANRSELRGFGDRVLGLAGTVKSLQIRNVSFAQFGDFVGSGGVIGQSAGGLTGAAITIQNSVVRADAPGTITVTGSGGGLYLELDGGSALRIDGTTFVGNRAANGGALQVRLRGNSTLVISGSTFQNNGATGTGGAIRVIVESGTVVIADSVFSGNTAAGGGRDIRIEGPATAGTAQAAAPTVYLLRNTYSTTDSVSLTGSLNVFTRQVALPLARS